MCSVSLRLPIVRSCEFFAVAGGSRVLASTSVPFQQDAGRMWPGASVPRTGPCSSGWLFGQHRVAQIHLGEQRLGDSCVAKIRGRQHERGERRNQRSRTPSQNPTIPDQATRRAKSHGMLRCHWPSVRWLESSPIVANSGSLGHWPGRRPLPPSPPQAEGWGGRSAPRCTPVLSPVLAVASCTPGARPCRARYSRRRWLALRAGHVGSLLRCLSAPATRVPLGA